MIIQNHTENCTSMMIIKLDQHSIILEKFWMKKHDVSYHDHNDSISFYLDHYNHLEASKRSFSNQLTKKKVSFSKENFFDQSKIIENKEIKIFFEKTKNSKTILKRSVNSSEKLIERRMNKSWRKKLKKIETSSSRMLKKKSKMNQRMKKASSRFIQSQSHHSILYFVKKM
jgi:hypothetical protein